MRVSCFKSGTNRRDIPFRSTSLRHVRPRLLRQALLPRHYPTPSPHASKTSRAKHLAQYFIWRSGIGVGCVKRYTFKRRKSMDASPFAGRPVSGEMAAACCNRSKSWNLVEKRRNGGGINGGSLHNTYCR